MKTMRSRVSVFFFVSVLWTITLGAAEEPKGKQDEPIKLEPFTHEFYWESFSVTLDSPLSPDGRYRLKKVCENGWVELIFSPTPTESQVVVAKPPPKKFEKGKSLPTVVVVESNFKKQTATLKELRMK